MDNAARPIAGRLWPVLATVALAAIQLVGTFRAAREQVDDCPLDLLAGFAHGSCCARGTARRPGLALGVVTTATLTFLLRDYAYGPVVLSQVVATVLAVVRGHRLAAWTATGALLVLHLGCARSYVTSPGHGVPWVASRPGRW